MLTGKCKEDFEKWLRVADENGKHDFEHARNDYYPYYAPVFEQLPFSMQYGVYVDFFDSFGIVVDIFADPTNDDPMEFCITIEKNRRYIDDDLRNQPTRHEARTKAIEKANEIYNVK